MKNEDLRRIQFERLEKIAKIHEENPPTLPTYTGAKLDLFGIAGCARLEKPHRPVKFAVCLNCERFDRLNMMCRVGRK